MKKIAILGSSGGNLYNLGGKQPKNLLDEIITQASSAKIRVEAIQFIAASDTMDNINDDTTASLFTFENNNLIESPSDKLSKINRDAKKQDQKISKMILDGKIDALVLVSADPKNINNSSITAAAQMGIPITGTGGTSMAETQNLGGNVISVSGTTGTTNRTRAISAISSLSKEFDLKYRPIIGGSNENDNQKDSIKERISIRGVMMSSLPGFIAMAITLALSKIPALTSLSDLFDLLINALPVVVASIAAYQVSGLGEVGIVSGIVAGTLATQGGIIGGIIAGILAGVLSDLLIRKAFQLNIPGTTANIISGGLSGLISGLIVFYLLAPVTILLGDSIRNIIQIALDYNSVLAGAIAGALIWPAIMGGMYHAAILPIVLLEMETNGMSFLGAIDMVSLVMVSAGITLANVIAPHNESDKAIALPGLLINLIFGTFVEASYPFIFANKIVFLGAIVAGSVGGMIVGAFNIQGTAYVPSLIAPSLSNNAFGFIISMIVALLVAFVFTVIGNKTRKKEI